MERVLGLWWLIFLVVSTNSQKTFLDDYIREFRAIRNFGIGLAKPLIRQAVKDPIFQKKLQTKFDSNIKFPCNITGFRSISKPKSIHKLMPGDIDVVGSMGDSLTAGFGLFADNLFMAILSEHRGHSFSIGGDETWRESVTIPNILKEFNPNLKGYATGNSLSSSSASHFNVAEGGAISSDMPYMSKVLVKRILNDANVDVQNDWKLITIFIGHNDFCAFICFEKNPYYVLKKHERDLLETFRTLRDNLPRTLVNLILPINVNILKEIKRKPSVCELTHSVECPCIMGLSYTSKQKIYNEIILKWWDLEKEIGKRKEFQTNDFSIVVQDFLTNFTFPRSKDGHVDLSVMSSDCFHLSQKGNAVSFNLWNSMMKPVGKKIFQIEYELFKNFVCPSKDQPFIYTNKNSKVIN